MHFILTGPQIQSKTSLVLKSQFRCGMCNQKGSFEKIKTTTGIQVDLRCVHTERILWPNTA